MAGRSFKVGIAALLLLPGIASAQQGVPFFPQTLQPNQVVGRLSSGPGPTEAISFSALLAALFPGGSAALPLSVSSLAFQGAVSGAVTVKGQGAAGTWTLQWPLNAGATGQCFKTSVSGVIATTSWANCAYLDGNNTWSGTQTFNGNVTSSGVMNITGTFQKSGTTQVFPASGSIAGTTDAQTFTNKSIDAGQLTGTVAIAKGGTAQATALAARGSSGLAVETQCSNGDSIFSIPSTCHTAVTSAAFTTTRVWTLPQASTVNAGQPLDICDQALALTGANQMTVTPFAGDSIIGHNGSAATVSLRGPGACLTLKSDGVSKWNNPASNLIPSIQTKTTGSGTITTPLGALYCRARMRGGGGGGAGSGTTPAAATAGTASTLDALTANGGALGSTTAGTTAAGGTVTGCNIVAQQGAPGGGGSNQNQTIGGAGGGSGGSPGGFSSAAPAAAPANSGGGGGGGGQQAAANGGGGGGEGGICEHLYTNPIPATLAYAVGPGGNAGGAGTGGTAGAPGGSGAIEFSCYFQ